MHSLAWWPTVLVVLIAAAADLKTRRIPNWLVIPFLIGGLVVSTAVHGTAGLLSSALGIAAGAAALIPFYFLGGMGMGDVKLLAAVGAWVGPQQIFFAFAFMGLAGGVMALAWALRGRFVREWLNGTADLIFEAGKRGFGPHPTLVLANSRARKMPYAPAIAVGTILSFFAFS